MTSSGKKICWKRYKRDALRIEMGLKGYIIEEREMGYVPSFSFDLYIK